MNEQQVADLFSEQLDRLLQGESLLQPDASQELQELLSLGQQVTHVEFKPSAAAQAAFEAQLAAWFGAGAASAAALGLSKFFWLFVGTTAIVVGGGLAALVGSGLDFDADGQQPAKTVPTMVPVSPPVATAAPAGESTEPTAPDNSTSSPENSLQERVFPQVTQSVGDTLLPPTVSLGDTLPPMVTPSTAATEEATWPVVTPTPGVETGAEASGGDENGSGTTTETDPADPTGADGGEADAGDHDRGHGNDPGGFDEDNPGQSEGVSGPGGNSPNIEDMGRGNGGGGDPGGGGPPAGGDNNGGGGRGNGGGKGNGKGK